MDAPISSEREWFYRDDSTGNQRGPVPATVLCKLLEKGIGVNAGTIVWKQGMESWLPMSQVQQFKNIIEFNAKQWYYLDSERNQQGPIISRMLIDKLKEQEIDGMTLVFGGGLTEWKQVSEVPELKNEMIKINQEEQAAEEAAAAVNAMKEDIQYQIFTSDTNDDIIPPYSMQSKTDAKERTTAADADASTALSSNAPTKKSFVADNGIRYGWDEEEQDWVELDDDDLMEEEDENSDNEGHAGNNGANNNKKRKPDLDEGDQDSDAEDAPSASDAAAAGDGATTTATSAAASAAAAPKKKRSKRKHKKAPNTWVYVTGLPANVTFDEIKDHFSKVGLIALSPYDQQPYIKIYRDESGNCKGDCSLCYNAEESVATAVEFLNEGYIRPSHQISVKRADFTTHNNSSSSSVSEHTQGGSSGGGGGGGGGRKPTVTAAQRKVAKSAIQQALTWNDEEDVGIKHSAALRIVVLEGMFTPEELQGPTGEQFERELEQDIARGCEQCGDIDKMTFFSKNPKGVVIVKFSTSFGAQECVRLMNGRFFGGRKISCTFWDGVTNHSLPGGGSGGGGVGGNGVGTKQLEAQEKEEQERLDEFGDWLDQEQEDLPEEFKLRTE